jgi:hypothetical protein
MKSRKASACYCSGHILYKEEGEGKNDIPHICLEMFVLFSLLFYARSRRLGLEIKKKGRPGWVGKISPTRRPAAVDDR